MMNWWALIAVAAFGCAFRLKRWCRQWNEEEAAWRRSMREANRYRSLKEALPEEPAEAITRWRLASEVARSDAASARRATPERLLNDAGMTREIEG